MESFAARVKRELQSVTRMPTHCRRAQKAGYEIFSGERSEWFDPKKDCCIRAFIRGAFVAAGTVSDPAGSYHFEITCPDEESAVGMLSLLEVCGMEPKEMQRKGSCVIYIKEGRQIRDLLTMMGAPVSMMNFENARILKEVRGGVNRRVNCETGNINKTVAAGLKQAAAIRVLEERGILADLPDSLRETAKLRLDNPDATIGELGEMSSPPVSKSGINHRLRKLCALAKPFQGEEVS